MQAGALGLGSREPAPQAILIAHKPRLECGLLRVMLQMSSYVKGASLMTM